MLTTKRKPLDEDKGESARHAETDDPGGPLVGALLRLAYTELSSTVQRRLEEAGYGDVQPRHRTAFQLLFARPEGARLTEVAAAARITKQSMAATLDQLVELGYVERIPDPSDKRAQLVRCTKRGRAAMRVARGVVREIERDWARRVGAERFGSMRAALEALVKSFAEEPA
jgi:DNA-binding MarR family transcriptional regulator